MDEVTVCDAGLCHMESVQAIYRHSVLHEAGSFEELPPTVQEMCARRTTVLAMGLPYLVALRGERVVGYAYAGSYRPRPAYRYTVENSVYVAHDEHGRGIGRLLLGTLIERCAGGPFKQMVAVIGDSANVGSVRLHASLAFEHVGVLRNVGFKFGRWVDTVIMQRSID